VTPRGSHPDPGPGFHRRRSERRDQPWADRAVVEDRLRRRLPDVEIMPAEVLKQNDLDLLVEIFAVPLQMMVAIAFAVGTAILGMVIYTARVERMREYGVLKAVGIRNRHLYWLVTQQGLVVSLIGGSLGAGLAWLVARWIVRTSPKFLVVIRPEDVLPVVFSGLLMGLRSLLLRPRQTAGVEKG